jgi:XTP/dITP diphosphohydrolase
VERNRPTAGGGSRPRLVLATRNRHKVSEIGAILSGFEIELLSARDFPDVPDVEENGETLEANAVKKAEMVAAATGLPALADDTGLSVDVLGGAPGVVSARYAGPEATYEDNNRKLLGELAGLPPSRRRATFRCVVAVAVPGGVARTVEGRTQGIIIEEPRGEAGFGYDPLFLPDGHVRTYAEMEAAEKNEVSHRGKAMRAARRLIADILPGTGSGRRAGRMTDDDDRP